MKFFVLTVLSFTDAISFITGMKGEILVKVDEGMNLIYCKKNAIACYLSQMDV